MGLRHRDETLVDARFLDLAGELLEREINLLDAAAKRTAIARLGAPFVLGWPKLSENQRTRA